MHELTGRSTALLILAVLALPYVRAPLCQAGSHDHLDNHATAGAGVLVNTPGEGSEEATDCHTLMSCAAVLQASHPVVKPGFQALAHTTGNSRVPVVVPNLPQASPDTPPPKAV